MGFDLYGNANNPKGEYFRNNVWWWRRLADYVCEYTGVIEEKDREFWQTNDGHKVSKEEAEQIANQLECLIETGHAHKYEKKVKKEIEEAKINNSKVEKLFEEIKFQVEKQTGKSDLAPREYPEHLYKKWTETYDLLDGRGNYPFAIENVKEFIQFCRNSEGFRIS